MPTIKQYRGNYDNRYYTQTVIDTMFTDGTIDHLNLANIGTNTHPQIDTHIASTANPHNVTVAQIIEVFDTGWISRGDWTNVHMGCIHLDYDNLAGAFTVGATVTGGATGDTGVIISDSGTTLVLSDVTSGGIFANNEGLTDDATGVTALVNEPAGSARNQDQDVTHDFNVPLSDLLVKVLISSDGTDANSFEPNIQLSDNPVATSFGITFQSVDDNNIIVQTGLSGIAYVGPIGITTSVVAQDWYYKIKVFKLT